MLFRTMIAAAVATTAVLLTSSAMAKDYKGYKFKGTIEVVVGGKLIVRDREDDLVEFIVAADTDITRDERPASFEELQLGDIVVVTAGCVNDRFIASRIFAIEPE